MDAINSVSKGIFLFKNGPDIKKLKKQKHKKSAQLTNKNNEGQEWYTNFREMWSHVETKIEKLQENSYGKVLNNLLTFLQKIDFTRSKNLQTAVLLTGINQTDHLKQFELLSQQISNNCPSLITILQSRDCPNVKSAVEQLVSGFINKTEPEDEPDFKLKKKQLTFPVLEAWFNDNFSSASRKPTLIVMINDFEQFNSSCMLDLITIMCCYASRLPIVLVIGIATAFKALHNVLPAHVTNQMDAHVFQSESSTEMLNKILDEVILNHHAPFQLSGRSLTILMDIFLFYDYSLESFIRGYKIFMLEHFYSRPLSSKLLRLQKEDVEKISDEDCDTIRRSCLSFRKWVESQENPEMRVKLITDNETLRRKFYKISFKIERFFFEFFCVLRVLVVMFEDLPKNELGNKLRELYPICIESDVTKLDEFKECFKLLRFMSKDKFMTKMGKVLAVIEEFLKDEDLNLTQKKDLIKIYNNLKDVYLPKVLNSGMSPQKATPTTPQSAKKTAVSRQEMMEALKANAKNNPTRVVVEYEQNLWNCLDYISSVVEKHLRPIQNTPELHEFAIFTDYQAVRRQIVGAPRGALHNALTNPQHYLQCSCCGVSESDQILPSLPDTSIAYKLHLENNKSINLYDWLQSFAMVISDEDENDISPETQARFTRAIAELQFLGFIKQAKHKTDHVTRLTW